MDNTARLRVLFERFLKDQCSNEEVEELFSYIKEKPISSDLDPVLDDVWNSLEAYPSLDDLHRKQLLEKIKTGAVRRRPQQKTRKWLRPLKIAAVVALVASIVGILYTQKEESTTEINFITKATRVGQRATYLLPDGSRVYLNAGSSIRFPDRFDATARDLQLDGEAFFEVVEDKEKPFVVASGGIKTRVLGTSFNIRAYQGQDIEVTVATGKVQVESLLQPQSGDSGMVLLTPNEQAVYSIAQKSLIQHTVDIRKYLAWNSKELILENTSMRDVIFMLEKRFEQKVILENDKLGNCTIRKAKYDKESLETILQGLQLLLDFKYEFNGYNQWTIMGKGCE